MATGLPIMITGTNTWQTAVSLQNFNVDIPEDDRERIELVQDYVAGHIDKHRIESLSAKSTRSPSPEPAGLPLSADRAGPSGQQARRCRKGRTAHHQGCRHLCRAVSPVRCCWATGRDPAASLNSRAWCS